MATTPLNARINKKSNELLTVELVADLGNVVTTDAANTYDAGKKQTFTCDATNAGINIATQSTAPSSPVNGDIYHDSATNQLFSRINGIWVDLGGAGGGSQTPWTQNIDADGFDLTDLSNIEFRTTTGAPAGTVQAIWADAGGININVPTGDLLDIQVNGVSQMTIDVSTIDFQSNTLTDIADITSITNLNGIAIGNYILTTDAATLTVAGIIEIATVAETNTGTDATRAVSPDGLDGWTGSAQITALGTIASGTWQGTTVAVNQGGTGVTSSTGTTNVVLSNSPTLVTPALGTPASGVLTNCTGLPESGLLDNAVTLAKMAGGTDGNLISFDSLGDPAYVATGSSGQVLTSNGAGSAPTFQAAATDNLGNHIATQALDMAGFDIDNIEDVILSETGSFRSIKLERDEILADDTLVGRIVMATQDGSPSSTTFANIDFVMESDVNLSEDGSIHIFCMTAGSSVEEYMTFNDASSGLIKISRGLDLNSETITNSTGITAVGTIATGTWQGTTVAVNQGGTGVTSSTGTTNVVLSNSPTLVTPVLGTPASGVLTNCTGLPEAGLLDNAVTLAKMVGGTDGNLISFDSLGDPAYVATGSLGQILTSNGAGSAPTFQAAAAADNLGNHIATQALDMAGFDIDNIEDVILSETGSFRSITLERDETLADDTLVGRIVMATRDGGGTSVSYGNIDFRMESDVNLSEDGSIHIFCMTAGSSVEEYMTFNDASSGLIKISRGLDLNSEIITNSTGITALGTIATGTWEGTTVASAFLDADTAHLTTTQTFSGDKTFSGSLEIPSGAGGTTINAAGEVTVDTTSDTLNFHDGTEEKVLTPIHSKSITIETVTASEDVGMFFIEKAITITKLAAVRVGGTSYTYTIRHGTDRSAAGAEVVTGGTAITSATTGTITTSFNDATIVANSYVWIETTASSGSPQAEVTVFYKQDA